MRMDAAAQTVSASQALRVAEADALAAYRDLAPFRVEIRLEEDGWHIDYELKENRLNGGGPHYLIDASDAAIIQKRYEQ
jgi:hypothetical protein